MGKRKSKTKVIKVKSHGLSSTFDCYACHGEDCITVKITKDLIGTLRCRNCNFTAEYPCNQLDRAIDVYAKWVDQIHLLHEGGEGDLEDYMATGGEYQVEIKEDTKASKNPPAKGGVKRKVSRDRDDDGLGGSYREFDGMGVEGDASDDEYDGDDLDVYDKDVVVDDTDDDEIDDGPKKKKKGKKSKKSFSDDEEEFESDFGSDSEAESSKKKKGGSKSSKKDKKDKKDKKEKKSKKFRSNSDSTNPADQELVQLGDVKHEITTGVALKREIGEDSEPVTKAEIVQK